jgi:hypothetical protein
MCHSVLTNTQLLHPFPCFCMLLLPKTAIAMQESHVCMCLSVYHGVIVLGL